MKPIGKYIIINKYKNMSLEYRLFDFQVDNIIDEDIEEDDENPSYKDNKKFDIKMFAINENGETACIIVSEYLPFFYIKVGNNWKKKDENGFLEHIKKDIKPYWHDSIVSCKLIEKKKLYGFDGGIYHKFIEIKFK